MPTYQDPNIDDDQRTEPAGSASAAAHRAWLRARQELGDALGLAKETPWLVCVEEAADLARRQKAGETPAPKPTRTVEARLLFYAPTDNWQTDKPGWRVEVQGEPGAYILHDKWTTEGFARGKCVKVTYEEGRDEPIDVRLLNDYFCDGCHVEGQCPGGICTHTEATVAPPPKKCDANHAEGRCPATVCMRRDTISAPTTKADLVAEVKRAWSQSHDEVDVVLDPSGKIRITWAEYDHLAIRYFDSLREALDAAPEPTKVEVVGGTARDELGFSDRALFAHVRAAKQAAQSAQATSPRDDRYPLWCIDRGADFVERRYIGPLNDVNEAARVLGEVEGGGALRRCRRIKVSEFDYPGCDFGEIVAEVDETARSDDGYLPDPAWFHTWRDKIVTAKPGAAKAFAAWLDAHLRVDAFVCEGDE